ncbi:uncharacterized protein LOC120005126 isoform X2 [Tripterygium wilfordii]|uniref:uncharacterized protein LOC120005126 isoform X2 n=1 Tax=Tripterygium wilfordii TaxID=458696 RepID=UPI0018F81A48|nr:uncharacterized protein LOC120005126 isoform X2 [Tripterygium wilfordii]
MDGPKICENMYSRANFTLHEPLYQMSLLEYQILQAVIYCIRANCRDQTTCNFADSCWLAENATGLIGLIVLTKISQPLITLKALHKITINPRQCFPPLAH